jgi:hypothetical protein
MRTRIFVKTISTIYLLTILNFVGFSQTLSYPIVGTGVSLCYGNTAPITCPTNTTDAFYGQFHGIVPSYQNNGNGTISDLNTGLMWIQTRGTKISWDSAFIMAAQCTVGGYNDWRVPTIKELYSLMNFTGKSGTTHPTCISYIDTTYFGWTTGNLALGERIIDAQDWSANEYTSLTMVADTTIFGLNTIDGRIKGYPKYQPPSNTTPQRMYIRFVRGNINYGINNFVDNGDNTISDIATGLMWSKNDDGAGMNWQEALAYAQTKNTENFLGHNDWRLPNAKELQSIVDYSRSPDFTGSAAIDPVYNCTAITDEGGFTDYPWYWTSTTHLDNMYGVYVTFGEALGYMKTPPTATYYTLRDVHGAGAQRSDPKSGSVTSYYLGVDLSGNSVYGQGPQGDVIRINNYVRLVRDDSSITGMNEIKDLNLFSVYPNPVSAICTISLKENISQLTIGIYDLLGSKVKEISMIDSKSVEIDFSEIPNGVYILSAMTDKGITFNKKLIVAK